MKNNLSGRQKKWLKLIGDLKGKTVLDVGCSNGWFEKYALEVGCKKIFGIEPNGEALLTAKKVAPRAEYLEESVLKMSFSDDFFDIVTLFDVIEHLPKNSERKVLKEIKRVLKPGGILYLSTPHKTLFSNLSDPVWYFGHRHYSEKKLLELLLKAGFKTVWVDYGGGVFSQLYMVLFYVYKFVFKKEMNFLAEYLDKKREEEYSNGKGFTTIFVKSVNC